MTNETIFYTQIATIIAFIISIFSIYRLLVEQKDSVIQLLKERLAEKEGKNQELSLQTSDVLVSTLSSRVDITLKEISRLKEDENKHGQVIHQKEEELRILEAQVSDLLKLITESDLVCPRCNTPLSQRIIHPIYGYVGGREVEADEEILEYGCGLTVRDGIEINPCKNQ